MLGEVEEEEPQTPSRPQKALQPRRRTSRNSGKAKQLVTYADYLSGVEVPLDPRTWKDVDTKIWLTTSFGPEIAERVVKNSVDGPALLLLQLEDICKCGISLEDAQKMLTEIQKLHKQASQAMIDPGPKPATTVTYENLYRILFKQGDEVCRVQQAFTATAKEMLRARLQEQRAKEEHKNLVRAHHILSDSDKRHKYDREKKVVLDLDQYLQSTHRKAEEGDLEGLKKDLEQPNANLNNQDENGFTALYVACRANQIQVVEWMLQNGADPDIPQQNGSSSLHAACWYGHEEIVRQLLAAGANIALKNKSRAVPYDEVYLSKKKVIGPMFKEATATPWGRVQAHNEGQGSTFQELTTNIKQKLGADIDQVFFYGQTLLMCAAKNGKFSLVAWLLDQGAQPTTKDNSFRTALHFAARGGHALVVKLLLEKGADPFALDYWGRAPDHECGDDVKKEFKIEPDPESWPNLVADPSKYYLFKYYLKDADLDRPYGTTGRTLLYQAAYEGHLELVKVLVARKANLGAAHVSGSTALHGACWAGKVEVARYLLACNANPFIKNTIGHTCIEEMETNTKLDQLTQAQLRKIFNKYKKFFTEVFVPVVLVNDKGIALEGSPFLVSCNAKMVQLVKQIDPTWNEFKQDQTEHQRWDIYNPLPYSFTFGNQVLSIEPSGSFLDAIIRVSHSPAPFFNFPITLKYSVVPEDVLNKLRNTPAGQEKKQTDQTAAGLADSQKRIEKVVVFQNVREGSLLLATVELKGGEDKKVQIPLGKSDYFESIEITFPHQLKANTISIFSVPFEGLSYPTYEFKPQTSFDFTERMARPSISVKPKPGWSNFSIYTCYPSQRAWIEIAQKNNSAPVLIPAMNTLISVIPKREIIPTQIKTNQYGKTIILQEGLYLFNELLAKNWIDTSDPEDIKIYFKLPDNVEACPEKYFTGYHGTCLEFIESIVTNGLLKPKSITGTGQTIEILQGHILDGKFSPLDWVKAIENFPTAIFLSPSFRYSALEVYAKPFSFPNVYKNETESKHHNAILECLVEEGPGPGRYQMHPATTLTYKPRDGENPKELEIRVESPHLVHIKCLHIISQKYKKVHFDDPIVHLK